MSSNAKIQPLRTIPSDKVSLVRKSIDPSAEISEPHLLVEENSFPPSLTIPKDNDAKRINALIDAIHVHTIKKEEEQPQMSSMSSFSQKPVSVPNTQTQTEELNHSVLLEPHTRRTVTFDDDQIPLSSVSHRPTRTSNINSRFSTRYSIPHEQQEYELINTPDSSDTAMTADQTNLITLFAEDEYIPGGFANLDEDLEEELLNDFDDEFEDQTTRRNRYISSLRPSDDEVNISRSPIELWQHARILIAMHLYKIQNKMPNVNGKSFTLPTVADPSMEETIDESDYLEKLFEQKEHIDEQKLTFGLSIVQQFSLDTSQQYQSVDFYDVEQGYIIMCNITKFNHSDPSNIKPFQSSEQSNDQETLDQTNNLSSTHLLVYAINRNSSNEIQSVEFPCSYQFDFMICIPIFRIILGFSNLPRQKSLLVMIGDASRKGVFLSKQEIPGHIYSIRYVHEASMLFLEKSGSMGRILLYNTQPLQFTSQPLYTSELPFPSMEPIIHICHIITYRSIGFLSNRYFTVWQYAPNQTLLLKFCNPYRYDFIRCHYHVTFDYIIFAFHDGFILIYQLQETKQIRRYRCHWKMITDLKTNQNILLSTSTDHMINVGI